MASVMARKRDRWAPPATSVPRPTCCPSCRYPLMGAMPEDRFMLDWGQWATKTPCSFIRARSSGPLQTQWAITVGQGPPKRPNRA